MAHSVSIRPSAGCAEQVSAAMFAAGAEALQEIGGELVTSVATEEAAYALGAAARSADAGARVDTSPIPEVDWSSAWRSQLRAHTVGFLTVTPPWLAAPFLPERTIVIDPAMAFGTGDHATTRGVLKLMQDEIRKGDLVADLGAGSAVLAIGAAKLGASRVAAIENDPDAIGNAEANVVANGATGVVTVIEADAGIILPLIAPVRVVLANIISSVIGELLPLIVSALSQDGVAVFSGMLVAERTEMVAAFEAAGFRVKAEISEGEWWSATVERA